MTVDAAFKALADPHRRTILGLVWSEEMSASEIAGFFDISRQAVSQHIGVLIDAELLELRREGTKRMYRSRRERVAELRSELDHFWASGLARLKSDAEASRDT